MKLKDKSENKNPLFNRKEVILKVEAESTPNNSEAKEFVSQEFATSAKNVKVLGIYGKFGSRVFEIKANVYDSKEDLEKTEVKTKQEIEAEKKALEEKIKAEEEKKKSEETAKSESEKPAEEAKSEESKEDKPEENKSEEKKE